MRRPAEPEPAAFRRNRRARVVGRSGAEPNLQSPVGHRIATELITSPPDPDEGIPQVPGTNVMQNSGLPVFGAKPYKGLSDPEPHPATRGHPTRARAARNGGIPRRRGCGTFLARRARNSPVRTGAGSARALAAGEGHERRAASTMSVSTRSASPRSSPLRSSINLSTSPSRAVGSC